jgi:putative transposase
MGRINRIVVPGIPHHVTQRGVRRMSVFFDDGDRESYIRKIASKSRKYGAEVLCWCLMPNHVHLIMTPADGNALTLAVGRANWAYVKDLNERHECTGRLFEGRFYSMPMDEWHSLNAIRYVLQNPVRAGIVEKPEEYPWSSARYLLGLESDDPLVRSADVLDVPDWSDFLGRNASDIENIRACTRHGHPYGDSNFVSWIEELTGRDFSKPKRGRPRKQKIVPLTNYENS